jgi:hypothetical protein
MAARTKSKASTTAELVRDAAAVLAVSLVTLVLVAPEPSAVMFPMRPMRCFHSLYSRCSATDFHAFVRPPLWRFVVRLPIGLDVFAGTRNPPAAVEAVDAGAVEA